MTLFLHNPANQAHIEELRDRLTLQLARAPRASDGDREDEDHVLIDRPIDVVRSMNRGALTPKDALEVFARYRVPGFSFGKWLIEIVDEEVHLEGLFNEAA